MLADQEDAASTLPPILTPAERTTVLRALLHRAGTQCRVGPAEITSGSHRAPAVAGHALIAHIAVLVLGMSSTRVAQFLGVSRQSVRRGLLRSEAVLANLHCQPEALLAGILSLPRHRTASALIDGRQGVAYQKYHRPNRPNTPPFAGIGVGASVGNPR